MAQAVIPHRLFQKAHSWLGPRAITVFVAVSLVFGGYFLAIAPPFMGGDEAAHFFRVFQLAEGQLFSDKLANGQFGGAVPENLNHIGRHVIDQLPVHKERRQAFRPPHAYYAQLRQPPSNEREAVAFTGAALYSPVAYAPMVGSTFIIRHLSGSNTVLIYAGRLANLATFMALGLWSLWLLKGRKSQWFILTILTFPMTLFEAATINADAILIGCCMLFLSALLRYWHDQLPRAAVVTPLVLAAVLVPLIKSVYMPLSLLAPLAFVLHPQWRRRSYVYAACLAILICLPAGWWTLATREASQAIGQLITNLAPVDVAGQIDFVLRHPLHVLAVLLINPVYHALNFATGIVGMLGMSWVWAPPTVTITALLALLVAFSQADALQHMPWRGSRLWHLGLIGAALVGLVALFMGFYITFTPVGWWIIRGIQGRYLIPFIPFLFWGFAYGKRSKIKQITNASYTALITLAIVSNALTMAIVYTWAIRGQLPTFFL